MRNLRVLDQDAPNRWAWRPGPEEPYILFPATRRFEWLAFAATPIGGFVAVTDRASAGGILVAIIVAAIILYSPNALRHLIYRAPAPISDVLTRVVYVIIMLGFAAMLLLALYVMIEGRNA